MSNKSNNGLSYGIVLLAMVAGMVLGLAMAQNKLLQRHSSSDKLATKMDDALDLIHSHYVDYVDNDSITNEMLNAMLNVLDPHSRYLSAEEMSKESAQIQGHFDGIGVVLRRMGDTSCVGQVLDGGTAQAGGLLPGDRIITIDTINVVEKKLSADEVVKLIRGRRNSIVDLGIKRFGTEGIGHYKIRRNTVQTHTVNYSAMLDKSNGYIRISSFAQNTHHEFCAALNKLKRQGMQRLIVDLRGNGGGLLETSLEIANELLPKGDLIVYTKGLHQRREEIRSTGNGLYTEGDLIVLIDESSASASEVLAGAIQDNDRGTIMGRRSFGKGLVQGQFSLHDGSALWLTTARYYTPSGRCIQRPYDKGYEAYYLSNYRQVWEETFSDSISASLSDTIQYHTKKGRVVYGGGGIVPDKVMPHRKYNDILYYNRLSESLTMFDYAFDQVSRNVKQLMKRYPTAEAFEHDYTVTESMINEMVQLGEKRGVTKDPKALANHQALIRSTIKSYVGQCLFGDDMYYKLVLHEDEDLKNVMKQINTKQ